MTTTTTKPDAYITDEGDGTFTAFVKDHGFRANVRMSLAIDYIRRETGRSSGSVPCWDKQRQCWDSELDIAEGA